MSSPLAKNLKKYGISAAIALGLAYLFVSLRVDFAHPELTPVMEWYRILCDGFTVPGLLFLMVGFMVTLSNQGALDGLGYVASSAFKLLIPNNGMKERYSEYLERRRANRLRGYGFLYVIGAVCMAVAGIFMALFYSLYA